MKSLYSLNLCRWFFINLKNYSNYKWVLTALILLFYSNPLIAQKDKDIEPVIECVKYLGNGLYQASFGYYNPTKKDVIIDETGSVIKTNNGKRIAKGLNKFKPGSNQKVFTKEFGAHDYVQWTIISNGNTHEVIANANSAKCEPADGCISPILKNGKSEEIISQELIALAEEAAGTNPVELIYQIRNNKVLIEIIPKGGEIENIINILQSTFSLNYNENSLESDFLINPNILSGLTAIDVYFPIDRLFDLNNVAGINFVRPIYPPMQNSIGDGYTGMAVSQGDARQKSDIVRKSFRLIQNDEVLPVDGTGVTIGVISNSYDTQPYTSGNPSKSQLDIINGDLPGSANTHGYTSDVDVLMEYPYGLASDEGRAMMHIIHDVAPGAKLAFHSGSLSPRNFELGFNALAVESDIIVDDITFVTEPFFGESRISKAIQEFTTEGKIHVTSAGNFANTGYQGIFNSTLTTPSTNFIAPGGNERAHIFDESTGDYLQKISVKEGATYMIVLQWDNSSASQDNSSGAIADLDIFVVDDNGNLLINLNKSNENGDAFEFMIFKAVANGEANILITSANGATDVPFRYIAFQSNGLEILEYNDGTPTISGHAMTPESVTVGAVRWNKDIPEIFSSWGGLLTNNTTIAVDFAAPDGVNTNVSSIGIHTYGDGTAIDGDAFPNFFGTSAAAPSAAAALALMKSAIPVWYPESTQTEEEKSAEMIDLFKYNAVSAGDELQVGYGLIDVNAAFKAIASQTAKITSFTIEPNENGTFPIASAEPITIKIVGEYFPPAPAEGQTFEDYPMVYFDGKSVDYTVNEDGSISARIPSFVGNPDIQIYTAPKEGSVNNGGFSEPYAIFQDGKTAITVSANPVTIKYGEDYTKKFVYEPSAVEGLPFTVEGLPDGVDFGTIFPKVTFTTTADNITYPEVNNYTIEPSFDPVADSNAEAENYIVNFKNANLAIERNYLTIRPADKHIKYGDLIENSLIYEITDKDNNPLSDSELQLYADIGSFYTAIANAHKLDFCYPIYAINDAGLITSSILEIDPNNLDVLNIEESLMLLINDFNATSDRFSEIATLLKYGGWMSSENSILNGLIRQTAVMNDFRQTAVMNDFRQTAVMNDFRVEGVMNDFRQSGVMNDFRVSAIMNNSLRIDKGYFTDYIDSYSLQNIRQTAVMNDLWEEATLNLRQSGVMNDMRVSAVMNDMRVGAIMNALDIMDLNLDAIVNDAPIRQMGIMNDFPIRQMGVMNDLRVSAVMNTMRVSAVMNDFRQSGVMNDFRVEGVMNDYDGSSIMNDYRLGGIMNNKVFTLIDYTDAPIENIEDESSTAPIYEIQKFYAQNLITGIDVTMEGTSHFIYPGAFLNNMAANFYILYDKGDLTIEPGILSVETEDFELKYGETLESLAIPTYFGTVDTNFELIKSIFPDGIPYYFIKVGDETNKEYTLNGEDKMDVGVYNIYIKDEAENYVIVYDDNHGQLTISEAILTVNKTTASNVKYGELPVVTSEITGLAYEETPITAYPDGIPYYFVKDGNIYIPGVDKMEVGVYDIFITDDESDNYLIAYATDRGTLTVEKAPLSVKTTPLELTYGDNVSTSIQTSITGFGYDEDIHTVFGENIPYIFVNESEMELGIHEVKEVGTYSIQVNLPDLSSNYDLVYADGHGGLVIKMKELLPETVYHESVYGTFDVSELSTSFEFAYDETVSEVYPNGIPFTFVKDGIEYGTNDKLPVGDYIIKIAGTANYAVNDYGTNHSFIRISKAALNVNISPNELIVNQGEIPHFETSFGEFAYSEDVSMVFPNGISFYFIDENGNTFIDTQIPKAYKVQIVDPANYMINYGDAVTTLYVNPFNEEIRKVRVFLECVSFTHPEEDMEYTAIFKYENDNAEAVFVPEGQDNNLSGNGIYEAWLPTVFLPGTGSFEIRFDGEMVIWSLTTYGSTNKSSVSSNSTSSSGKCDGKIDKTYEVFPNPVTNENGYNLFIRQNILGKSHVYVIDINGFVKDQTSFDGVDQNDKTFNLSGYLTGMYFIRIVSDNYDVNYGINVIEVLKSE